MTEFPLLKAHCNLCRRETNHSELFKGEYSDEFTSEDTRVRYSVTTRVLACRGCGTTVMQKNAWNSEGTAEPDEPRFYPPPSSRPIPPWLSRLSFEIYSFAHEVYGALNGGHLRLALIGCRTLLDLFILKHVGDVGTFAQKLDALETKGFVSEKNRTVLEVALDAGSAAAHRGHRPSAEDLSHVVDIVENLLQSVALKDRAKALRKSIPRYRRRRKPKRRDA